MYFLDPYFTCQVDPGHISQSVSC